MNNKFEIFNLIERYSSNLKKKKARIVYSSFIYNFYKSIIFNNFRIYVDYNEKINNKIYKIFLFRFYLKKISYYDKIRIHQKHFPKLCII